MKKRKSKNKSRSLSKPRVGIVVGSASDLGTLSEVEKILKDFGVPYWLTVASAHRTPALVKRFIRDAERRGVRVFVAGAGGAAALPGVVAAETLRPVIGVPIETKSLKGLDSLLSIAQMPGGIPVAAVGVGSGGARNAGLLAVAVLAAGDSALTAKLVQYRKRQARKVTESVRQLSRLRGKEARSIYL